MYDALAAAEGVTVPPAEPAEPASYREVAKMVNATKDSPPQLQRGVSRLVKRAGADTTLQNAKRDGAEFAWIPHGDTCAFCLTLASRGWQRASANVLKGGHAEHIHANCDCEFAIRFSSGTDVAGYDPEKYLQQYRAALGKGLDPEQSKATLGQLYDNLIAVKKAKGIGQKSLDRYEDNCNNWGSLKDMPAGELKASDFQRVLNELADWHDGKPPLSHFTLTNLRSSAKAAYELAIPEIVLYNPLVKTTAPAGAPPEPREPISEEQQQWIRETPHNAQRAAMLLLYSGLRRGEATALTWADVDLADATITVSKGYDFADKKSKNPKTAAGVRVVSIPKVLVDYLKTQQDGCLYVLHNSKGKRMTEQGWKRLWESYMRDLNVKYGYHGEENKNRLDAYLRKKTG